MAVGIWEVFYNRTDLTEKTRQKVLNEPPEKLLIFAKKYWHLLKKYLLSNCLNILFLYVKTQIYSCWENGTE